MQRLDLFIVADLAVPEDELPFHPNASGALAQLVERTLRLPEAGRKRLREVARSLPVQPPSGPSRYGPLQPTGQPYPPGFGSLFARMLALRNMSWGASVQVLHLMSGIYLSTSNIGGMVRGLRVFDAKLVIGLAAVFGMPAGVLATLMDVDLAIGDHVHSAKNRDAAALLWEVRQLTSEQVWGLSELADQLNG
ncbi:hypothetical protein [Lentzea flaviverrucosa]|uniref:hypothetical protein n=1 Tax=Lentzea flaviverrucosa TaxID=200379 RepID=UPI000B7EE325|nr:hypothetical protein [Lentzea flaviverrucosa]